MAHNSGYLPDAAVRIGRPDRVLLRGQRSRVERCHPSGHRFMCSSRFASGMGPPPCPSTEYSHARSTVDSSEFPNPAGSVRTAGSDSVSSCGNVSPNTVKRKSTVAVGHQVILRSPSGPSRVPVTTEPTSTVRASSSPNTPVGVVVSVGIRVLPVRTLHGYPTGTRVIVRRERPQPCSRTSTWVPPYVAWSRPENRPDRCDIGVEIRIRALRIPDGTASLPGARARYLVCDGARPDRQRCGQPSAASRTSHSCR